MLGYKFLGTNEKGNLSVGGCDCVELVKQYGTPLYVMDEGEIRGRCREIRENHIDKYNGFAVYASKAFLNKEMCRIIHSEGLGLDVVSGGELFTAAAVDFPMEKIIFHGNNKSYEELEMAVDFGVGRIVIDNFFELENLNQIAIKKGKSVQVMLRISPGIDGHTHEFIQTGNLDSKFGFPLVGEVAFEAVERTLKYDNLKLAGLHSHIGSQLQENEVYELEIILMARFAKEIFDKLGYVTDELDVGGGFGIYYSDTDCRKDIRFFTEAINNRVAKEFQKNNLVKPMVIIEPGRWLVGEAGITLYTIGAIKNIEGVRKYVSVDGGMTDNLRPPLYDAKYSAVIANKKVNDTKEVVTIAGRCCESGDVLIRDIELPQISSGDILAVLSTGAYNYSMASNYNRLPKPGVIMIKNGAARIIVKKETYEDLIKNDI